MSNVQTTIFQLYKSGYTPGAIARKTGLRLDKVTFILGKEILQGKVEIVQPSITIVQKLPKKLLSQFPYFTQTGPYLIEFLDGKLLVSSFEDE